LSTSPHDGYAGANKQHLTIWLATIAGWDRSCEDSTYLTNSHGIIIKTKASNVDTNDTSHCDKEGRNDQADQRSNKSRQLLSLHIIQTPREMVYMID
jgi:hypothetical protein